MGRRVKYPPIKVGDRFHRWQVVGRGTKRYHWICKCDCGNVRSVVKYALHLGESRCCGCIGDEYARLHPPCGFQKGHSGYSSNCSPKHGKCGSGAWRSWQAMKTRCTNPRQPTYKNYGGRGITYCPAWELFANFFADMGERPEGKSLDRIDVNGNYCKDNCRWATKKEQQNNQRKHA